ncbi:DNA polymerase III subunit delta [Lyngbya sp. CCY1209]|uniref:DNA polymerase III subunit delta n=1 Tax=Lyngbya sp. CCY1209 TaxID=2886103 RepID=UPI002D2030FA|nr:DNA polymerase III subunit delta [Lyngbya sp. CCY1209]MEB3883889.1 DNA polymerase III subunit delta [Lyngbya sp. CCY1209]
MPIYLYWGEDDFSLTKAVDTLRESVLDPNWSSFNFDKILPDTPDAVIAGLNQAMTPPFGLGHRFVWLVNTPLTQNCSQEILQELERTLPAIPETTTLLLSSSKKPDGRLKSTKLLQKYAQVREFSPIPPWKSEQLEGRVREVAREVGVRLEADAVAFLAEAVGNETRQLYGELEKLKLYANTWDGPLTAVAVAPLIHSNTQNSLKLAAAIREGNTGRALGLVADLVEHNEPALKILATLVGQFRTWLWVKLMVETGAGDDREIAKLSEVGNPKRIYFLKKEVQPLSLGQLQQTLPLLLELEAGLKRGADEFSALQTYVVQLCHLFRR